MPENVECPIPTKFSTNDIWLRNCFRHRRETCSYKRVEHNKLSDTTGDSFVD